MKIVLDLKNEPIKDDLLIFDGKEWNPISSSHLLNELNNELADLKKDVAELKQSVNNKLKEHHEVLQLLSKGGK